MVKAIIFKEWLKIRWVLLASFIMTLATVIHLYLNLSHDMEFMKANSYWYDVIIRHYIFYRNFKFLPALIGLLLGLSQWVPEIIQDRFKLTLHLPSDENKLIIQMILVGISSLLMICIFLVFTLWITSSQFFPSEIIKSVFITIFPWLISGFGSYLAIAGIVIEPHWRQRILLIMVAYGFLNFFYYLRGYNLYGKSWPYFLFLTILISFCAFYSSYRYRKGVS